MNHARHRLAHRVSLAALMLGLLLGPTITLAQTDTTAASPYAELAAGNRIRLTTSAPRRARTVGSFIALRADTLVMQSEWEDTTMSRVLDGNTTLELSQGTSSNFSHNFLMGVLIGGGVAFLVAAGSNVFDPTHESNDVLALGGESSLQIGAMAVVLVAALCGTVGGVLGGTVLRHEDWRMLTPTPEAQAHSSLDAPTRSVAVVTWHFK